MNGGDAGASSVCHGQVGHECHAAAALIEARSQLDIKDEAIRMLLAERDVARSALAEARRAWGSADEAADTLRHERNAARTEAERWKAALQEIAEYGGGDGGDWVECCNIARAALSPAVPPACPVEGCVNTEPTPEQRASCFYDGSPCQTAAASPAAPPEPTDDPKPPAFVDGRFSLDFLEWAKREGKRRAARLHPAAPSTPEAPQP